MWWHTVVCFSSDQNNDWAYWPDEFESFLFIYQFACSMPLTLKPILYWSRCPMYLTLQRMNWEVSCDASVRWGYRVAQKTQIIRSSINSNRNVQRVISELRIAERAAAVVTVEGRRERRATVIVGICYTCQMIIQERSSRTRQHQQQVVVLVALDFQHLADLLGPPGTLHLQLLHLRPSI